MRALLWSIGEKSTECMTTVTIITQLQLKRQVLKQYLSQSAKLYSQTLLIGYL